MIKKFSKIYEPSGVIQHSDGNILVIDDEGPKPLSLLTLKKSKSGFNLDNVKQFNFAPVVVDDLEALTIDSDDNVYAISSHSRDAKGKLKGKRNCLVRFSLHAKKISEIRLIKNLREWIISSYPELKKSGKIKSVQKNGGFNIEGIAYDKHKKQLLIGLRSPLDKQEQAIIIPININKRFFDTGIFKSKPNKMINLDLQGAGIRDFTYVPHLNGFLILSGTSSDTKKSAGLWFWKRGSKAHKVKIKGADKIGTAEGITPVKMSKKNVGILIVIDDGEREKNQPGHYVFVPYKHLKIKSS